MKSSVTITVDGVGPVLFEKSKRRARKVNISVEPSKPVRVAVPRWVSFENAYKIMQSRLRWIRKHSARMNCLQREHASRLIDVSGFSEEQKRQRLIQRTVELATHHGFRYHRIFIRKQRTRWGSCSSRNNISLNIKLMQLPDTLIDYIILHELLHLRIKNHGRDFWTALDGLTGNAKALSKEVKSYHLGLME